MTPRKWIAIVGITVAVIAIGYSLVPFSTTVGRVSIDCDPAIASFNKTVRRYPEGGWEPSKGAQEASGRQADDQLDHPCKKPARNRLTTSVVVLLLAGVGCIAVAAVVKRSATAAPDDRSSATAPPGGLA